MTTISLTSDSPVDLSWRSTPLPNPEELSSDQRVQWVDRMRITKQSGVALTVDELKFAILCLSANRIERERKKAADRKSANEVMKALSLEDL